MKGNKIIEYLRPRIPDYSVPTCSCGSILEKVEKRVTFRGVRSIYDWGRSDRYWHCPDCQSDWILVTPKRIILHLSDACKAGDHQWCTNRNFSESSCTCKCHSGEKP